MPDESPTESKAAHTAGPWTIRDRGGNQVDIVSLGQRTEFGEPFFVAFPAWPEEPANADERAAIMRANARLIAAAPETKRQRDMLLEVAKATVDAIDGRCGGGSRGGYIDNDDDEYRTLRAAIAAAQGEET